jgi:hypothetical protein
MRADMAPKQAPGSGMMSRPPPLAVAGCCRAPGSHSGKSEGAGDTRLLRLRTHAPVLRSAFTVSSKQAGERLSALS